jgi:hypothetical protein
MTYINIIFGILTALFCIVCLITSLTVGVLLLYHKKLRTLSIGILAAALCINDAISGASFFGYAVAEYRIHTDSNFITQRQCFIENIGMLYCDILFTILWYPGATFGGPVTKASLLILTLDRLYAMLAPVSYRVRNHIRFGIIVTIVVNVANIGILVSTFFYGHYSDTIYEWCNPPSIQVLLCFNEYSIQICVGYLSDTNTTRNHGFHWCAHIH